MATSDDLDNPMCICGHRFYGHDEQGYCDICDPDSATTGGQGCGGFMPKKEASGNPLLKKIEAMSPAVKSDAAGSHHDEIEGNPLLEHRVGSFEANYRIMGIAPEVPEGHEFWSDVPDLEGHPELWAQECPYTIPKHYNGGVYVEKIIKEDSACENCGAEMNTIERLCSNCSETSKEAAAAPAPNVPPDYDSSSWVPNKPARQPMQDDSGSTTGLRRRPDHGESDSRTSTLNSANSKGASAQYVIALDARSRKEASKTATMYVTGIDWDGLKVANFTFGDIGKALRLPNLTAKAVSKQLIGPKFGVKARPIVSTT